MSNNIIDIPLSKDELKGALEVLKRGMSDQIEGINLMAKLRKAKYDAHIKEGFTPEQALEICKGDL